MSAHVRGRRRGAVLLEAIVALTILGSASVALLALARQLSLSAEHAAASELSVREADRLMQAAVMWSRDEYVDRLGVRAQGPWLLEIQRLDSTMFALVLTDSGRASPALRTLVYRPGESRQ